MGTVVDLQRLTVESARGSGRAATRAWTLLDESEKTVGFVVEQVGSTLSLLRRHMSTNRYRYDTTFHVTDPGGAVELVLARTPGNRLKTQVDVTATLADGTPVARSEQSGGGLHAGFTITDPAGTSVAAVTTDGLTWEVGGSDGTPLATVTRQPITRSVLHPDGRTQERFVIGHRPEASARLRVGVLATVIGQASSRPG